MLEFLIMLLLILINLNYFIIIMLIFMMMIYMLFKLSWLDWWMIIGNFGFNFYNYGLLILLIWIFMLIMLSLKKFNFFYLILMIMMYLNFLSLNLIYFYLFFEISLLMIFYIIIIEGYSMNRFIASYYIMFYTMVFSLPMLFIMFYIYQYSGTLFFFNLENMSIKLPYFLILYLLMSFLVKIPMYLFHYWLLKAHVEAPYYGSMILASLMLKLGSYGLLRIMYLFKMEIMLIKDYLIFLSLLSSLLLSLICLRQIDMKIMVAISSIIHMSLMLSGLLSFFKIGILGAYLMMISHGITSSGMFYLVNIIYEKSFSRLLMINKGMLTFMPSMSLMWFLLCSSNMSAPFSMNLVSEILLLISIFVLYKFCFLVLMMYCILSFIYSLYLFVIIQHGNSNLFTKILNGKLINYLILMLHWLPLNLMVFNLILV